MELGYFLASEEHSPLDLVRNAAQAEQAGFRHAMISDHYHPWIDRQGHSPFVWAVIGGISQATSELTLCTGVTCPTIRTHPAIIAQAAATAACMMPGRFSLGVGAGENLNEHITGQKWPPPEVRLEMLEEAVEFIRQLWGGAEQSHRGRYYTVEDARIYDVPDRPPAIVMAAGGDNAIKIAADCADGLIMTSPSKEMVETFRSRLPLRKPVFGKITVCWDESEEAARRTAFEQWPTSALQDITWELRRPADFESAVSIATEEQVVEEIICGPDAARHIENVREYADAGFDRVYVHQVGPDQKGFFRFYEREVLPAFSGQREKVPADGGNHNR